MVKFESDAFQLTSTGSTSFNVGFEPDLIIFRVPTNISQTNTENNLTDKLGWGHGFAKIKGGISEKALAYGTGSNSTNGIRTGARNNYSIYALYQSSDGETANGRVEATVTGTSSSSVSLQVDSLASNNYVIYEAYQFDANAEITLGDFQPPTGTGNQSYTTGFEPNFLYTLTQPNESLTNFSEHSESSPAECGFGHGIAAKNSTGIDQATIGVTAAWSNVDDHTWASYDGECLLSVDQDSKGSLTGQVRATLNSFDSNGFTLNYTSTDGNPLFLYCAVKSESKAITSTRMTPSSTQTETISTPDEPKSISVIGSSTIGSLNSNGFESSENMGWMHGSGINNTVSATHATNSNSINAHVQTLRTDRQFHMLSADSDGTIEGRAEGTIKNFTSSSFDINWTTITSNGDLYSTRGYLYYAFQSGGPPSASTQPLNYQMTTTVGTTTSFVPGYSWESEQSMAFSIRKALKPSSTITLYEQGDTTGQDYFIIKLNTNGYLEITHSVGGNTDTKTIAQDVANGNWHRVMISLDNTPEYKIYVDDILIETLPTQFATVKSHGNIRWLGGDYDLDEYKRWTKKLSSSEITEDNKGFVTAEPSELIYWSFDNPMVGERYGPKQNL